MKTEVEVKIKIPITFDILKGQPETKDNSGYDDEIIDINFSVSKEGLPLAWVIIDSIERDRENIEIQIWKELKGEK